LKLLDEESGRWRIEQKSMRNCLYLIVKRANYCFLHNNQLNEDGQTSTVLRLAESDRSSSSSSFGPARFVLTFRLPPRRLKHLNFAANARWSKLLDFWLSQLGDRERRNLHEISVDLVAKFAPFFPDDVATLLLESKPRFNAIVCSLEPSLIERFVPVLATVAGVRDQIFVSLIDLVDSVKTDRRRIRPYFGLVSAVFDQSCDATTSLNFCMSFLSDPNSSFFASVTRFLRTVLEHEPSLCLSHVSLFDSPTKMLFRT
jgi:hypothetical protein